MLGGAETVTNRHPVSPITSYAYSRNSPRSPHRMPSALRLTSTASFYEAKLPSEALLGPSEDCNLRIPYVFLTNGGGISESKRALELSSLLGVKISPLQVLQGHTPFKQLVNRFENELIVRFLSKTKYFTVQNQKLERTSIASISPDHEIP